MESTPFMSHIFNYLQTRMYTIPPICRKRNWKLSRILRIPYITLYATWEWEWVHIFWKMRRRRGLSRKGGGDDGLERLPCFTSLLLWNSAAMAWVVMHGGMLNRISAPTDWVLVGEDERDPDLGEDMAGEELWMNLHLVPYGQVPLVVKVRQICTVVNNDADEAMMV